MDGRLKVAVVDVTGDKELQREGKVDQASAATRSTIDDLAEKAESSGWEMSRNACGN
jgi:uncharacterized protein YjbJ (UPF0337 family)